MNSFVLQTERLILRPHHFSDVNFMVELNSDIEVTRYTGDGPINEVDAEFILKKLAIQFSKERMGRFLVFEKLTGEKIGWAGLSFLQDRGVVDLGYRFLRNKWRLGYATEASKECLRYGFTELNIPEITARVDSLNVSSIRVLEKLMMTRHSAGLDADGEYFDYRLTKIDYLGRK